MGQWRHKWWRKRKFRGSMVKMKKLLITLIILVVVAIVIAASFYHSANYTLDQSSFTTNALAMVEKQTRLKIPQGSRGLNMVYEGFKVDPAFVAKIEIPTNAEMGLKSQIEGISNQEYHPIGLLSEKVSWWKPAKNETALERTYAVNSSLARLILCHQDGQIVLYVEWFSF